MKRTHHNPRPLGWRQLRGSFGQRALAAAATTAPVVGYVYGLYTPSWYEIRKASCDSGLAQRDLQELLDALRAGYVPGTGLALAVGVAASLIGRSWLPLLVAGGTAGTLIALHEAAVPPGQRLSPGHALAAGLVALRTPRAHSAALLPPGDSHLPAVPPAAEAAPDAAPPAATPSPYGL